MKYIECPEQFQNDTNKPSIFLGGGITNCKNWQEKIVQEIKDLDCVIYNPRRKIFDFSNPIETQLQINWEFKYLNSSDIVLFYFCEETLCPITLFEYGARLTENSIKPRQSIYVYIEEKYVRKIDVILQTRLQMTSFMDIMIFENYDDFVKKLKIRIKNEHK